MLILVGRTAFDNGLRQVSQAAVLGPAIPWRFVSNHSLEALVFKEGTRTKEQWGNNPIGTLLSENRDAVHWNFFALIPSRSVNWKYGTCVRLELKRGDRVRVQGEIVNKFIPLSFQFLSCSCVGTAEKCTKKVWCTCSCRSSPRLWWPNFIKVKYVRFWEERIQHRKKQRNKSDKNRKKKDIKLY